MKKLKPMIKFQKKSLFVGVFLIFSFSSLIAQETVTDVNSLGIEEYNNISLPPLDVLFENAKAAPSYELAEVQELVEKSILKKEKRAFLSFFSVRGSWQYGTFANDGYFSSVIEHPAYSYSKTKQTLYSVGASVGFSLEEIFDLGPRVKRQKLKVRAAELEKEERAEMVKKEIIELYAQVISKINVLKISAESVVLANEKYKFLERSFANGTIEFSVLATEKENQSMTRQRFEDSKFELNKSLMILELITQTPIIRK